MLTADQPKINPTSRLADKVKLRKLYVHGHGSLENLCISHKVPYGTAVEWFRDERWPKLKQDYDQRELAKLSGNTVEQPSTSHAATGTAQQLSQVNEAILASDDASEIERLTRAKLALMDAMHYELHGCRIPPGKLRSKPDKRLPATPQPVQEAEVLPESPSTDAPQVP